MRSQLGRSTRLGWLVLALILSAGCDDGKVRFGPPGGLRIRGGNSNVACPIPDNVTIAPGDPACPSWSTQIFPLLDNDGPYICALAGCHNGPDDDTGVNLVQGQPGPSYAALAAFTRGEGDAARPYVSTNLEDKPYFLCNVDPQQATPLGSPMPKSPAPVFTPTDFELLAQWAACGMVDDSMGGPGVGGAGGAVGMGGAAGAGGQ